MKSSAPRNLMPLNPRIWLALVVLLASAHAQAEFVLPAGITCPSPDAEFVEMSCEIVFAEQAENELNQVYKELLSKLGNQEASLLKRSQKAWLSFRTADVALVSAHYGEGGSQGRSIEARRIAQLTRDRIKDLRQRLSGTTEW